MGVWGTDLYDNDCTCDVRDTYIDFLQQFSDEEAYKKTIEMLSEYIGSDEEPLLWYALADTQWQLGCLIPEVKEKALKYIEQSNDFFRLNFSMKNRQWQKTLNILKVELDSQMPKKKKIKPKEKFITNPWNIGDVYAYELHDESEIENQFLGKYIVIQKISDEEYFNGPISRIQVFNKIFDNIPQLSDLNGIGILPLDIPDRFLETGYNDDFPLFLNAVVELESEIYYPEKYLTFIGNKCDDFNYPLANINSSYCYFDCLDQMLSYYKWWGKYDYVVSNGEAKVFKKI